MERTALREEFFEMAREDPYLAQIKRMYSHAWVEGYRRAIEDLIEGGAPDIGYAREREALQEFLHEKSYSERLEDALAHVTQTERRAEELVSLALLGTKLEKATPHVVGPMGDVSQARYCYCGNPESHV